MTYTPDETTTALRRAERFDAVCDAEAEVEQRIFDDETGVELYCMLSDDMREGRTPSWAWDLAEMLRTRSTDTLMVKKRLHDIYRQVVLNEAQRRVGE